MIFFRKRFLSSMTVALLAGGSFIGLAIYGWRVPANSVLIDLLGVVLLLGGLVFLAIIPVALRALWWKWRQRQEADSVTAEKEVDKKAESDQGGEKPS